MKKYHDSHSENKEILITIRKAVDASPELRSKKALIENFISGINEQELTAIIAEEKLKPEETRQYIETALQAGEIKTTGTDIDRLMPPVSRFGSGNRAAKKQGVIDKLKTFFNKFFGIV